MRRSPDLPSLVAGAVVIVLGAVLLADAEAAITLSFEVLAPIACAAVGAILLVLGFSRPR